MDIFVSILTTAGLIIIGVLLFELIIFFHEGGHFVSAKLSGVRVNEFALGMGPKLFSFTKGETTYSLRLLPIGGFCAMEGEDEDSDNPHAFNNAKLYKRLIIIVAGAVMNIVLGLIFMTILLLPGKYLDSQTVALFVPNSYSASSGLQVGDTITSVNGYKVNNSMDFSYSMAKLKVSEEDGSSLQIYRQDGANYVMDSLSIVSTADEFAAMTVGEYYDYAAKYTDRIHAAQSKGEVDKIIGEFYSDMSVQYPQEQFATPEIKEKETRQRFRADMTVLRDGEKVILEDVDFYTFSTADSDKVQMSIDFYTESREKNFFSFVGDVASQTVSVVRMVVDSLVGIVRGEFGFTDVSGPIGATKATVEVASESLKSGFGNAVLSIVYVMMVITVNLGVVNMLPFPALDGGRFVFLLIEGIFRRPIPRKAEAIVNAVGLGLLLLFMLIISIKDIVQIFI